MILNQIEDVTTENLSDDENPHFLFSTTHHTLLVQIASGQIDPLQLAKTELKNRGLSKTGEWNGGRNE
jgi:hypothetical protein